MYQLIKNNFPKSKITGLKYFLTGISLLLGLGVIAQNKTVASESFSIFSNTLFDILVAIIVLLLIIISVLSSVLKNVAEATKDKYINKKTLPIIATLILLSFAKGTFAQEVTTTIVNSNYMGLTPFIFFLLISIIGFEIIIIFVLINSIQLFIKEDLAIQSIGKTKKEEPSILEKLNASVAIEEEASILMDHDYDGIKELDNNLPPWWKYGFYVTIIFGIIYLIHFHVTSTGDLQAVEYKKSMDAAKLAKEEYQKTAANNVNENTVTLLTDATLVEKGKTIFKDVCSACHGVLGEGGVGPNLTDDYWLHGGSIKDLFITIKYGWPTKGMKAWENDYSPSQIQQIASYIKTLRGTNPPKGKEKQGDLYIENNTITSDSTKTDSTAVIKVNIDSTAISKK